jgi:hypothetical protein
MSFRRVPFEAPVKPTDRGEQEMQEPTIKTTAEITLNDLGDDAYHHMIEECSPTGKVGVDPDSEELKKPLWRALVAGGYPPKWFADRGVDSITLHAEY